ncbi:Golgi transport complex subunit 1, partial [Nowakowskiella sp. JEL0078]
TSFPVVQRQWDAVSHFKSQILEKATLHLKQTETSDQNTVETLCAIILLDNITPKQVFSKFLEMRKLALSESLQSSINTEPNLVSSKILTTVRKIISTLHTINTVFLPQSTSPVSLIETYILSLQRKPIPGTDQPVSAHEDTVNSKNAGLSDLYSDKTNMHVISRHLPPLVQNYVPVLTQIPTKLSAQITDLIPDFIKAVDLKLKDGVKLLLREVETGSALETVILDAISLISKLESSPRQACVVIVPDFGLARGTSSFKITECGWDRLLVDLGLEIGYSIWGSILEHLFHEKSLVVIRNSFARVAMQSLTSVNDRLSRPGFGNVGKEMWAKTVEDEVTLSTKVLKEDCLVEIGDELEGAVKSVVFDLKGLFLIHDQEIYKRKDINLNELTSVFWESWISSVRKLSEDLINMLDDLQNSLKEGRSDEYLLFGKIAREFNIRINESRFFDPFESSTKKTEEDYKIIETVGSALMNVYYSAFSIWSKSIIQKLSSQIGENLETFFGDNRGGVHGVWEEIVLKVENETGIEEESKFKIPAHVSEFLMNTLFLLCNEINRIAGYQLEKKSLHDLIVGLSRNISEIYKEFCANKIDLQNSIIDQRALQLLLDFRFLIKIFEGSWNFTGSEGKESKELAYNIVKNIKELIDPIDLALIEPHLISNVERCFSRSSVLLGLLLASPVQNELKRNPSAEENHSVIPSSLNPSRFVLLPVGSTSRSNKFSVPVVPFTMPRYTRTLHEQKQTTLTDLPFNTFQIDAHQNTNSKLFKPELVIHVFRSGTSTPTFDPLPPATSTSLHQSPFVERSPSSWNLPMGQAQKATEMLYNAGNFLQGLGGVWAAGGAGGATSSAPQSPTLPKKSPKRS